MTGQRDHFLANALLQAAVAHERVGVVVDQRTTEACGQIGFGHRHAERIGNALTERAGGHLDAVGGTMRPFGMAFAD